MTILRARSLISFCGALALASLRSYGAGPDVRPFLEKHCAECHDAETKKGELDLTALKIELANRPSKIHLPATLDFQGSLFELDQVRVGHPGFAEVQV